MEEQHWSQKVSVFAITLIRESNTFENFALGTQHIPNLSTRLHHSLSNHFITINCSIQKKNITYSSTRWTSTIDTIVFRFHISLLPFTKITNQPSSPITRFTFNAPINLYTLKIFKKRILIQDSRVDKWSTIDYQEHNKSNCQNLDTLDRRNHVIWRKLKSNMWVYEIPSKSIHLCM